MSLLVMMNTLCGDDYDSDEDDDVDYADVDDFIFIVFISMRFTWCCYVVVDIMRSSYD